MQEIVPSKQTKVQIIMVLIKGLRAMFCIACSQDVRRNFNRLVKFLSFNEQIMF